MLVLKQEHVLSLEAAWGICLIGFIVGRFPGIKAFDEVRSSWDVPSKYFMHETGWIVFKFENESDRDVVYKMAPMPLMGLRGCLRKCHHILPLMRSVLLLSQLGSNYQDYLFSVGVRKRWG